MALPFQTPNARRNEPQALAKRAIHIVEQKIAEEFGIDLEIGAELEFAIETNEKYKDHPNPLGLEKKKKAYAGNYLPSSQRTHTKTPWFPDSPYITYFYKESDTLAHYHQYEAVLSHTAFKRKTASHDYSRAVHAARAIETTYNAICGSFLSDKTPYASHYRDASATRHEKVKAVLLDPYIQSPDNIFQYLTNGLHINVSIHSKNHAPIDYEYLHQVSQGIDEVDYSLIYLLGADKLSFKRHDKLGKAINIKKRDPFRNDGLSRIENALPSASSNPYYAVLVTLIGVYRGLETHKKEEYFVSTIKNVNPEKAKESFFEPNNYARHLLNSLEPELGERFFTAIENTPPGTEIRTHGAQLALQAR